MIMAFCFWQKVRQLHVVAMVTQIWGPLSFLSLGEPQLPNSQSGQNPDFLMVVCNCVTNFKARAQPAL